MFSAFAQTNHIWKQLGCLAGEIHSSVYSHWLYKHTEMKHRPKWNEALPNSPQTAFTAGRGAACKWWAPRSPWCACVQPSSRTSTSTCSRSSRTTTTAWVSVNCTRCSTTWWPWRTTSRSLSRSPQTSSRRRWSPASNRWVETSVKTL